MKPSFCPTKVALAIKLSSSVPDVAATDSFWAGVTANGLLALPVFPNEKPDKLPVPLPDDPPKLSPDIPTAVLSPKFDGAALGIGGCDAAADEPPKAGLLGAALGIGGCDAAADEPPKAGLLGADTGVASLSKPSPKP